MVATNPIKHDNVVDKGVGDASGGGAELDLKSSYVFLSHSNMISIFLSYSVRLLRALLIPVREIEKSAALQL